MKPDQAAEHLQVIRTLMERSAVYRRALAPIMIFSGTVGLTGCIFGTVLAVNRSFTFVTLWFATAAVALIGSFLLVRKQALKDSEPLWSPPTRRVASAMLPGLTVGLLMGVLVLFGASRDHGLVGLVSLVWCIAYGCALHSAGSFAPRGVRILGWFFIIAGCSALFCLVMFSGDGAKGGQSNPFDVLFDGRGIFMGIMFGGLHLAYGIYLYFTEKRRNEP